MKRFEIKDYLAAITKYYKFKNNRGLHLSITLDDIVRMLMSRKPILIEFPDNAAFESAAGETLAFYLMLQLRRKRSIGISDSNYGIYRDDMSGLLEDLTKEYIEYLDCNTMPDITRFSSSFTGKIRSQCNDIVFVDSPEKWTNPELWFGICSVIDWIDRVHADDRNVVVLSFGDHIRMRIPDVDSRFLCVGYSREMKLVDDWILNGHRTFIDPEFEMKIMNPDIDRRKMFQFMGTKYPSKLRSYLRFDRKFVMDFLTKEDLELML